MPYSDEMKIFSGSASEELTKGICEHVFEHPGKVNIGRFSDGEVRVQIGENIRGKDVFLVNSTSPPINDHLMELLILCDAARRASASRVTVVLPYYGYARQDRKDRPRVPITAKPCSISSPRVPSPFFRSRAIAPPSCGRKTKRRPIR